MRRVLAVAALAAVVLAGCKPESEPDWPYVEPPGGTSDAAPPLPPDTPDVTAMPGAPEVGAVAADGGGGTALDAGPPGALSADELLALRRPVAAADLDVAERETQAGRALQARMELREALRRYQAALSRVPGHPRANYQAARTLALLGDTAGSLRHLRVLAALESDPARELLAAARSEADLRTLRTDEGFRTLTRFGSIGVAVRATHGAPADPSAVATLAAGVVDQLAAKGLPAAPVDDADPSLGPAPLVFYAAGQDVLAREVVAALGRNVPLRAAGGALPVDVLVLWDATPLVVVGDVPLTSLLDQRLSARDDAGLHLLQLRSTGFYESEDRAADGSELRRRRGRYRAEGTELVLSFDETLERYPAGAELPEVTMGKGEERVPFTVGPGRQVTVSGRTFRPVGSP